MSMPIWCEVVCRECANTGAGRFVYGAIPRKEIKTEAVRDGWKFKDDECFCSQVCLAEYEKTKN